LRPKYVQEAIDGPFNSIMVVRRDQRREGREAATAVVPLIEPALSGVPVNFVFSGVRSRGRYHSSAYAWQVPRSVARRTTKQAPATAPRRGRGIVWKAAVLARMRHRGSFPQIGCPAFVKEVEDRGFGKVQEVRCGD